MPTLSLSFSRRGGRLGLAIEADAAALQQLKSWAPRLGLDLVTTHDQKFAKMS